MVHGDRLDTIQNPIIFVVLPTGDLSTAVSLEVKTQSYPNCLRIKVKP